MSQPQTPASNGRRLLPATPIVRSEMSDPGSYHRDSMPPAQVAPITMPYYFGAPWLPVFAGSSQIDGSSSLQYFRERMQSLFKLYTLTEEQKIEIVIGQLQGSALREVKAWADGEKGTVQAIFKKLESIFDTRTAPELRSRLYARKQRPQESLREFALALQEAMKAVQAREGREVEQADETLINLFIEGARGEAVRAQLRMWKRQNPDSSFSNFKEAVLEILGMSQTGETWTEGHHEEEEGDQANESRGYLASNSSGKRGAVMQQTQSSQDPIGVLTSAVTEMIKELKEMRRDQADARQQG